MPQPARAHRAYSSTVFAPDSGERGSSSTAGRRCTMSSISSANANCEWNGAAGAGPCYSQFSIEWEPNDKGGHSRRCRSREHPPSVATSVTVAENVYMRANQPAASRTFAYAPVNHQPAPLAIAPATPSGVISLPSTTTALAPASLPRRATSQPHPSTCSARQTGSARLVLGVAFLDPPPDPVSSSRGWKGH